MNYTFFPENLIDLRYNENITWLVMPQQDWENGIISGVIFSSFSVATAYCRENSFANFVITIL